METIEREIEAPTERDLEAEAREACSLATLHDPQAALEAARRLYRHNRAGLRFFCENRRVVPVDQLEELGEFGEYVDGSPVPVVLAPPPSLPEAARSSM